MEPALEERFYSFLAGREGKKDKTLDKMMRTFRRMRVDGFRFDLFVQSEEAAQLEGDRYMLWLRTAPPLAQGRRLRHGKKTRGGGPHVVKVLKALARLLKFKEAVWNLPKQAPPAPDCYTLSELDRLLRLPYGRSEEVMLERAVVEAHLALGWRLDEHVPFEDAHIDASNHAVLLANPEKGNPVRKLPVEQEFFAGLDGKPGARNPIMAWLRSRPVYQPNPRLVWVYTDSRGVVRPVTAGKFADILRDAGKKVGVRANCTRGRHTRCAALLAQGKQLAFVRFFMGHSGINTLTAYIEQISMGLLNHLKRTSWFVRPPQGAAAA
ncbi:MAG: hypothetical protein ACYC2H_06525 [Thermoplasmatota archaeon]